MGIVSALGNGVAETADALLEARCTLRPITLFEITEDVPMPVGNVELETDLADPLPRTHHLAHMAAEQALANNSLVPDAIVVGTTTGGILTTEALLEKCVADPDSYRNHGLGSVAEDLARRYGCSGPLITVSTACSSGAVALLLGMEMLRSGKARRVLVGGVEGRKREIVAVDLEIAAERANGEAGRPIEHHAVESIAGAGANRALDRRPDRAGRRGANAQRAGGIRRGVRNADQNVPAHERGIDRALEADDPFVVLPVVAEMRAADHAGRVAIGVVAFFSAMVCGLALLAGGSPAWLTAMLGCVVFYSWLSIIVLLIPKKYVP